MEKEPKRILLSFIPGLILVGLLWLVYGIELSSGFTLSEFGVQPRDPKGLKGILLSPFLHGDLDHLISNSVPLLVLVTGLIYFYRQVAIKVFLGVWLLGGFWLWLGGRDSYHIGASGVIYGLTAFLLLSGMLRKDNRLMALSLLVVFLYGGMVWGLLPIFPTISFEAHLFGAIAGLFMAWIYRLEGPQRKVYDWELEEEEEGDMTIEPGPAPQQPNVTIHYIYTPLQQNPTEPENKQQENDNEKN